jgi:hypothetical protein
MLRPNKGIVIGRDSLEAIFTTIAVAFSFVKVGRHRLTTCMIHTGLLISLSLLSIGLLVCGIDCVSCLRRIDESYI